MNPSKSDTIPAEPDTTTDRAVTYLVQFGDHLPSFRSFEVTTTPDDLATEIHAHLDPEGRLDFRVSIAEDGRTATVVNDDESESGYGTLTITEVEPDTAPTPGLLAAVRQVIDAGRLEYDGSGVDVDAIQGEAHTALVHAYQAATGTTVDAERDHRDRLADELVRFADAIRTRRLPAGTFVTLNLGVLAGRADLEQLTVYLGSEIREDGGHGDDIPFTERTIRLDGTQYGPELTVRAQIQPDGRSEVERLRAENAALLARLGVDKTGKAVDPWRCPVCGHEAEHLLGAGCVARPGGQLGMGACGCKHVAAEVAR